MLPRSRWHGVEALNALSLEFASEIASVFRELGANDDVRAIIFCSKARIFCAGLDLKEAAAGASDKIKVVLDVIRKSQPLFDCCNFIEECPKPVIAAVHGKCIGGGLDMASACDIRLLHGRRDFLPQGSQHRPGCRHGRSPTPADDRRTGLRPRDGLYSGQLLRSRCGKDGAGQSCVC